MTTENVDDEVTLKVESKKRVSLGLPEGLLRAVIAQQRAQAPERTEGDSRPHRAPDEVRKRRRAAKQARKKNR